ncbi:MAG: type II secretion system GspH family protein [Clostridium sp.]|jgi:prepilin-type N-terminal cleavage/methylation domain-containing protein|uniref:pilus assembly FimT family protein n=1 Tax=Clostridium sp. TaxID=1506 RepID=UPI0025C5DF02|nr:type II secretion system protein [Clostridium sp.]MCH3964166.1 type II secretion system GspH family protein [Clostridium sp.]MCI1715347.1 type II secretion system GspH family protein [Clostridium sp.]MCI1799862.1 type II secretion system GspH family protein [Clostridium sp.]MCI1813530.1 type II secretion system GspH family protein [Clostridium sp.]MCI1870680.1 type II secretion system GspH family protein [Clostridium sp.]
MKSAFLKKKGFTLIELLIVLGMMSIILGFSMINLGALGNLKNDIEVNTFDNEILHFINRSRIYCHDHGMRGYISFDLINKNMTFNSGSKRIFRINFPEGFIVTINTDNKKIDISSRGIVEDAGSIEFKDRKENMHCITVCVGTFSEYIKY